MVLGREDVSDDEDRILTAVFRRCEELRAPKVCQPTNAELAAKYGISLRTVANWRREGCPFDKGQWGVLDWLAGRRYAPAGARAKFAGQLKRRRPKFGCAELNAMLGLMKLAHVDEGIKLEPGHWLRSFRCPRGGFSNARVQSAMSAV